VNAARIADQIAQVDRDLAEVDEQVEMGELDEPTADRLRTAYRAERAALEERLTTAESAPAPDRVTADDGTPTTRSRRRAIVGTAVLGAAVVAVAAIAVFSLQDRTPAAEVTDGVATAVLEGQGGRDLASISVEEMEGVVAQNPDIPAMRIALADRYLEAGNYPKALEHYMVVLDQEPENATALVRVGWLTFLSGEAELAEPFLVRGIAIEPDFPQAYWFLANVRMELGDTVGAVEPLQRLLAYGDLPTDVRTQAEELLKQAQS
jgi:predicted Zn-dependent protease